MDFTSVPNVYGEGIIFAFSGLDGKTDTESGFVGSTTKENCGLLIHTKPARFFRVSGIPENAVFEAACGDMISVKSAKGESLLKITFSAWHSIVGSFASSCKLSLTEKNGSPAKSDGTLLYSESEAGAVVLSSSNGRFALCFGASVKEALIRAEEALKADLDSEFAKRIAYYGKIPKLKNQSRRILFNKCMSILKVNTLSPEYAIKNHWSTPDRVPHRKMWLWDSVFHSFLMNEFDAEISWQFLKSVIDMQREDGMVPHMMGWKGEVSEITQPPVLAWGVWKNYQASGNKDVLKYALPRLERYLDWNMKNRDFNKNGLLEWFIEQNELCRSGESGLDNSTRFDEALLMDAVDFSSFQAIDYDCLAKIADALGEKAKAAEFKALSDKIADSIQKLLWSEKDKFYLDLKPDGTFCKVRAVSGFLPLLLDNISKDRVDALVAALKDKADFGSVFPVPSVSLATPDFSTDMWRGATWLNFNWFISEGLKKHGHADLAEYIREKTLFYAEKYFKANGTIFEFYDAKDIVAPWDCYRKGPRKGKFYLDEKIDSIRDYNWSSCFTALMLLEQDAKA